MHVSVIQCFRNPALLRNSHRGRFFNARAHSALSFTQHTGLNIDECFRSPLKIELVGLLSHTYFYPYFHGMSTQFFSDIRCSCDQYESNDFGNSAHAQAQRIFSSHDLLYYYTSTGRATDSPVYYMMYQHVASTLVIHIVHIDAKNTTR